MRVHAFAQHRLRRGRQAGTISRPDAIRVLVASAALNIADACWSLAERVCPDQGDPLVKLTSVEILSAPPAPHREA